MSNSSKSPIGKILWIGIPCVMLIVAGLMIVSTINKEVELRNQLEAHQETNKAHFDKMWKVLQTQAGITNKYKEDFKEIWVPLIEGRYKQGGGKMMQWVQERNPDFNSGMYEKLMVSVEAQREGFFQAQKGILDVQREHNNLRKKFPSGMILSFFGDNTKVEVQIITSSTTKETFETGEENEVDLFK